MAASLLLAQTAVEIEDEDESVDAHASVSSRFAHKVVFQVWGEDGELHYIGIRMSYLKWETGEVFYPMPPSFSLARCSACRSISRPKGFVT